MIIRNRVIFVFILLVITNLTSGGLLRVHAEPTDSKKMVAITVDDLLINGPGLPLPQLTAMTDRLTGKLVANHVPAIGFVNECQLFEQKGEIDSRISLLDMWLERGLDLGNHTYSHVNVNSVPLAEYEADIIRGETITTRLLTARGKKLVYFRYPYLSTGPTQSVKSAVEKFLKERHYTNAPVTLDAQDWWFSHVYSRAKEQGKSEVAARIAQEYLSFTDRMIDYFEKLSMVVNGRPMRQILLMHSNPLNADHFDELAKIFKDHGYEFVSLADALKDPAYDQPDTYVGNDGMNWLERWRNGKGKPIPDNLPAEPKFVQDLYKDPMYKE